MFDKKTCCWKRKVFQCCWCNSNENYKVTCFLLKLLKKETQERIIVTNRCKAYLYVPIITFQTVLGSDAEPFTAQACPLASHPCNLRRVSEYKILLWSAFSHLSNCCHCGEIKPTSQFLFCLFFLFCFGLGVFFSPNTACHCQKQPGNQHGHLPASVRLTSRPK